MLLHLLSSTSSGGSSFSIWIILAHIVSTIIIVSVASTYLWKPTCAFLGKNRDALMRTCRQARVSVRENQVISCELKKAKAEFEEYREQMMKRNRVDRAAILKQSKEEAIAIAGSIRRDSEVRVNNFEKASLDRVKQTVVDFSVGLTEKLVEINMKDSDNEKMVKDYIASMEKGESRIEV